MDSKADKILVKKLLEKNKSFHEHQNYEILLSLSSIDSGTQEGVHADWSPSCGWGAELCALSQMDSLASNKGSAQHGSLFLSRSRASLFYLCLSAQTLRELAIFETVTLYQIQLDNALKSC